MVALAASKGFGGLHDPANSGQLCFLVRESSHTLAVVGSGRVPRQQRLLAAYAEPGLAALSAQATPRRSANSLTY